MRFFFTAFLLAILLVACAPLLSAGKGVPTPAPRPPETTLSICGTSNPITASVAHLQDLLPGCDYSAWFETDTTQQPDAHYFGVYKFLPWGADLYLGFGAARPAETDGALLAKNLVNALRWL